jgi:two-component system sensor histidine kinase and response regulator WspE
MTAAASALVGVFQSEAAPHVLSLRGCLEVLAVCSSDTSALASASAAAASLAALAQLAEQPLVTRIAQALREHMSAAERGSLVLNAGTLAELWPLLGVCERAVSSALGPEPGSAELTALAGLETRALTLSTAPAAALAELRAPRPPAAQVALGSNLPRCDGRLLELFREDLAGCAAQLGADLVQLESSRDMQVPLARLMRAAHSLKGAARAVGIDGLVELAHEMEECFVAAQRGELVLEAPHVDRLLAASDVLNGLAQTPPDEFERELDTRAGGLHSLAQSVRPHGQPARAAKERPADSGGAALASVSDKLPVKPPDNDAPVDARGSAREQDLDERVVRVAARSVERLVGLSAEALVQARRTEGFTGAITQLKQRQAALLDWIEMQQAAGHGLREQVEECRRITAELAPALDHYVRAIEDLTGRLYHEALQSRMRPFAEAVQSLPRLTRDLARRLDKRVQLSIVGERTQVDRDVLESLQMPLQHLLRNAIDHGFEIAEERKARGKDPIGTLRIEARHQAGMLAISVADDGRGIDLAKLRQKLVEGRRVSSELGPQLSDAELLSFLFLPGISTAARVTDVSGRGVGLDVVKSAVEASGGSVRISTQHGRGTTFHLQLPVTRSVIRALIIEVGEEPYALPLMRVERIIKVQTSAVRSIEQRQCIEQDGEYLGLVRAHELLETANGRAADELVVLVISEQGRRFGVVVDRFIGEQDLVVRPLDRRLGKVPNVAAASLLNDGTPVLILDVDDLVRSIEHVLQRGRPSRIETSSSVPSARQRILVVDDSLIVRELHKQMLVGQGYDVTIAVDGMDGWLALQNSPFQLVVSDIDMPRLNGFELVRRIKQDPRTRAMPVIIVSYKDREEDRLKGLEAGADYYLTKSSFHDRALLDAVHDLLGEPA